MQMHSYLLRTVQWSIEPKQIKRPRFTWMHQNFININSPCAKAKSLVMYICIGLRSNYQWSMQTMSHTSFQNPESSACVLKVVYLYCPKESSSFHSLCSPVHELKVKTRDKIRRVSGQMSDISQ